MPVPTWAPSFSPLSIRPAEVRYRARLVFGTLLTGCGSGQPVPPPSVDPVREGPRPEIPADPAPVPPSREPIAPYSLAHARGWMALASTGVTDFLAAHPTWDGRGVLIGILDGGVDVGAAGLESTSTGAPKVIDLRDFSGEGRTRLMPLVPRGDSVRIGETVLGGFGRVRALDADGPWFGGVVSERRLGDPPASDVNGNGRNDDMLPLVVARASDGWVLFGDTDGDGSLAGERGVRDFLLGRETLGWRPRGAPSPLAVAANFSGAGTTPVLDLFFDTGGHGTHVAGIAAGYRIGKVSGFNGVAPGAQLLGLKIARNDFGGITTSGSVVRGIDYAIRFARERGLPLVLNMSYGVGNEREGAARLDVLIDSILAVHPEVLFVTSAGNDGPGLSTIGFPGTVRSGLSVGATYPGVFIPPARGRPPADVLAFFSSRGGEVAKPDLVAPGYAFSTVPPWEVGDEFKGGTSMAAPHIAGLGAILLSAARQSNREVSPADIRRALLAAGRPVGDAGPLDQGAGQPSLALAWAVLKAPAPRHRYQIEVEGNPRQSAVYRIRSSTPADSFVKVQLRREPAADLVTLRLTSSAPWLRVPPVLRMAGPTAEIRLVERLPESAPSGAHTAVVEGHEAGVEESRFRVVVTVIVPTRSLRGVAESTTRLAGGGVQRLFFIADSGRPFRVTVETASSADSVLAFLHFPGGAPVPGIEGLPSGANAAAGVIAMDGRRTRGGLYEAVAAAAPLAAVTSRITATLAPVVPRLGGRRGDTIDVELASRSDSTVRGEAFAALVGAEREWRVAGGGRADVLVPFRLPGWAGKAVIDLVLPREQWPEFTDFGLALRGADGRIIGKQPLNYAAGRLTVDLPARPADELVEVVLAPGFAEDSESARWSGSLTIRLYSADAPPLASVGPSPFSLAPRKTATMRFVGSAPPWPLPDGFQPLLRLAAEVDRIPWTTESVSPP
jgi:subtilisin family serine protease